MVRLAKWVGNVNGQESSTIRQDMTHSMIYCLCDASHAISIYRS